MYETFIEKSVVVTLYLEEAAREGAGKHVNVSHGLVHHDALNFGV